MKPTLPKGTRDFGPLEMARRNYIFQTLRNVFTRFGFRQLETPAMENLETLTGKYGEEGDQLIFKILNSRLYESRQKAEILEAFQQGLERNVNSALVTERALRYDLTVPMARYVAMNNGNLPLPFKRFQIQPVWRADKPQKGRYREFYQCDCDVLGSNSLQFEAELFCIYQSAFRELGIPVEIRFNSRKILNALVESIDASSRFVPVVTTIDKLDKIGMIAVCSELAALGLNQVQVDIVKQFLEFKGPMDQVLENLVRLLGSTPSGPSGIAEIREAMRLTARMTDDISNFVLDPTLARGLAYYTGIIYEVRAVGVQIGSIGGGGRYDNLTSQFGVNGISGIGISFGADRIYDVMEELDLFRDVQAGSAQVLCIHFPDTYAYVLGIATQLRNAGIRTEVFAESSKLGKQFTYADRLMIPYVLVCGSAEMESGLFKIKELASGTETTFNIQSLIQYLNA